MENWAVRWLWPALRALALGFMLCAVLLQTYGLYLATAIMPHERWRRKLDHHLHRALFALDQIRLAGRN